MKFFSLERFLGFFLVSTLVGLTTISKTFGAEERREKASKERSQQSERGAREQKTNEKEKQAHEPNSADEASSRCRC